MRRRRRAVDVAIELLGGSINGATITVLGAAFKPDSDDIQDSPALDVATSLHDIGATVGVTDPKALENARRTRPGLTYIEDVREAVTGADVLLHLTEWREYRELDPHEIGQLVAHRSRVHGRARVVVHVGIRLDHERERAAGPALEVLHAIEAALHMGPAEVANQALGHAVALDGRHGHAAGKAHYGDDGREPRRLHGRMADGRRHARGLPDRA